MKRLRLSQQADDDILRLYVEGAYRFGREAAENYYSGLLRTLAFLSEYPFAARERLEIRPPVRIHPFRTHVIVYIIDDQGVLILRVRHARENWESNPTA